MNTKLLMTSSAILMGTTGIALSFLPQELARVIDLPESGWSQLILQVAGAQYVAFAMINWMAKSNLIGGIYSKPVAMGNLIHFGVSSLALLKLSVISQPLLYWGLTGIYIVFAICFGYVFFSDPLKKRTQNSE